MRLLAIILGRFFAHTPQILANCLAYSSGTIIYYLFPKRRRMMLSNLHHAFPNKSEAWRKKIARTSCRRMIELGLFLITSPFFSKQRIQKILSIDESALNLLKQSTSSKYPQVLLIPHFSLTEAIALYRGNKDGEKDTREIGVVFRPLNNKTLNQWIKKTRERLGVKLLSRKEGFSEAINILRRNGSIAILFDQNAGAPGILGTFFGRLASSTQLPDLLAKKTNAQCYVVYTERMGFWKARVHSEKLPNISETPLRISANVWLENKLKENDNYCADWLWFHNRWKTQDSFSERYRMTKTLDYDSQNLKQKTRLWFRMPNWLGDIIMAIPLIQAIQKGRPDAEITLLVQTPFIPLLKNLGIAKKIIPLPNKNWKYFFYFWKLRTEYPDTQFLFTNSERADFESWLIHAPQRFGMERPGKGRPLLTHTWKMPKSLDETQEHQTYVWAQCLEYFGLQETVNVEAFNLFSNNENMSNTPRIGLICGTENNPEKRWPEERWKELIETILKKYPSYQIYLYGTSKDKEITERIANGFNINEVIDQAGKTNLIEFSEALTSCCTVICNDTGGMHLANALGTPVIGIFGPTNPIRTGPIFSGKKIILQPLGCPSIGGKDIDGVEVSQVIRALEELLN